MAKKKKFPVSTSYSSKRKKPKRPDRKSDARLMGAIARGEK